MKKTYIISIIVIALVIIGVVLLIKAPTKPGQLDGFAQCLADKGTTFYGAFWCPNCQTQKVLFGRSVKLLPYIECSTPDGNKQLQICKDKGIKSYPTWEFPDGTRQSGELSLEVLRDKTGCELPTNQ
ncbi:MAG: hypothetical protein HQ402_01640 [Parcubacteria group bacterium]|nr:hypothetical protein [Parcubacteria group bacterium]